MRTFDVVVVGGGAAGIMAAGVAASRGMRVLLCEKMEKPQRKVRITGKGSCNVTNMRSEEEFLEKVRSGASFFAPAFHRFNNHQTVSFFEQIGVPMTTERGERVFPTSRRAWDVAQAHIAWCEAQGAVIECHTQVIHISSERGQICGVSIKQGTNPVEEIDTPRVIIATGGVSYPATGSTGDGYLLAHSMGHRIVEVRPSLTPLVSSTYHPKALRGLSLRNVAARLVVDQQTAREEFGELEFAPFGVTGPIVLRMSRDAVDALIDEHNVELVVDLKPALSETQLQNRIQREREALSPQAHVKALLGKLLPSAFISLFLEPLRLQPETPLRSLGDQQIQAIIQQLKAYRIPLTDYRPFEEAIVTAGGVDVEEVHPETMESRLVRGLYFAGEVLDIDADTGGYNLQIAYSTGHLAGELQTVQ